LLFKVVVVALGGERKKNEEVILHESGVNVMTHVEGARQTTY
jgi:hypothetical protein